MSCFFLTALTVVNMMLFDVAEGADAEEEDEEPVEDLLKPGHLSRLLEEELAAEVEALCVGGVSAGLERLLSTLQTHRDSCQPAQLQVPATASHHPFKQFIVPVTVAFTDSLTIYLNRIPFFIFVLI